MELSGLNPVTDIFNSAVSGLDVKSENKANSFENALNKAVSKQDDRELRKACKDMEAYFIQTMFREMRKTIDTKNSLIPKSQAENIFQDMLDEEISKSLTETGGIGFADMMYRQLSLEIASRPQEVD